MLKRLRFLSQIFVFTIFMMGVGVSQVLAATYGAGSYGEGLYSIGENPTPAPSASPSADNPVSSGSSNGGTSAPSDPSCTVQKPSSVPDLFQINGKTTTGLILFFAPVPNNRDRYYVSYSTNPSAEEFGFEFENNADGVISVDVQALKANTVYYFKVRAGNGCQPGDWSNVLAARTGQRLPSYRWSSLPRIVSTAVRQRVQPSSLQKVNVDTSESPAPKIEAPSSSEKPSTKEQQTAPSASPSLLQRVTGFIRGLFGK